MEAATIIHKLHELTEGLYFMSESDYPFEIIDWGKKDNDRIVKEIVSFHKNGSELSIFETKDFLNKIIDNYKNSGDALLQSMAERYFTLLSFLLQDDLITKVYKCGKIEVGVYIVIINKDNDVILLRTTSIET